MAAGVKSNSKGLKGGVNRFLANHLDTILSIAGKKMYKKFVKATHNVEAAQADVLQEILAYARDTAFGRDHQFNTIEDGKRYQKQIPAMDYEGFRPYVDRHQKGEENVLFPGKPLMYNRSSGTTALPKLIPVSPHNFQRCIKNRGKLWLYGLLRHYPGIYAGKSLSVVSPAVEGHTEDGTPFGSISGVVSQNIPEFMKLTHAVPYSATLIDDYRAKVYTMLRLALASDVTLMLTANPATVLNLVTKADAWKEDLIRDIRDGTLKRGLGIEPEIRAEIEQLLAPAPDRAKDLIGLASANETLRPADYWPRLGLIHTWKNGNTRLVIPKLLPWFKDDTPILDFGYVSTEILATDIIDPETDGSILQVQNGYYEFSREEDGYDPNREFLLAHQLEVNQRYYFYVTTFSGLYRYDMNDVVEVIGRFNEAPILRFLYKGKGITSIQGEKLSEEQFIEAVVRTSSRMGIEHDFFIGFADTDISGYRLYIEFLGDPSKEQIGKFETAVDKALSETNIEYASKLKTERLKPICVVKVGKDFFSRYRDLRLEQGTQDGQIKWLQLSSSETTRDRIERLMIQP